MDKKDKKDKDRLIAPIICILMSLGLWFYVTNVENKIRSYDLNRIPVELVNVESLDSVKLALAPNQEFYVNLNLEGLTNDIYKVKKSDFKIQVDLSEYALKKGKNKIPVTIVDWPTTVRIKNNNMLSITVEVEEMVEKDMTIKSNIKVNAREGYFASEVTIDPKEVKVSGAESVVNKVTSVVVSGEENDVYQDISKVYSVKAVDDLGNFVSGVTLSNSEADVSIKVSKGKVVPLKVNTSGQLPSGVKINSMEQSKKEVEILGPKEILETINGLEAVPLDLSKISDNKEVTLGIIVPEGVKIANGEDYVVVKITVSKVISKDFDVKLTLKGVSQGLIITPIKNTVKVTITGYEDRIAKITPENIKAELNVEAFKTEGNFEEFPNVTLDQADKEITVKAAEKIGFTVSKEVAQKPEGITLP